MYLRNFIENERNSSVTGGSLQSGRPVLRHAAVEAGHEMLFADKTFPPRKP